MHESWKRIIFAVIAIPIVIWLCFEGGYFFFGFVSVLIVLGLWEFYTLSEKKITVPSRFTGITFALIIGYQMFSDTFSFHVILLFLIITMLIELFKNRPPALLNVSVTVFGTLYVTFFLGSLSLIRELPQKTDLKDSEGAWLIVLLFVVIWVCDTLAYFGGQALGRHKLFPRVSPNKTIEGTVFGFLGAIICAMIFHYFYIDFISLLDCLIIGAIGGTAGQLGDLVESLFKRDAGVKDTSSLLPGHGGVLDRFDAPMLAAPITYFYLYYLVFNL